jgi:hypothetical protein
VSTSAWIIMVVSIGSVLALTAYCVIRVLTLPPVDVESLHGPADIDTKDTKDAD